MPDVDPNQPPETPPGAPEAVSAPPQPATPAPPASPTFSVEQVGAVLESGIERAFKKVMGPPREPEPDRGPDPNALKAKVSTLDAEIEAAMSEGKPIMGLIRQRDDLRDQIFEVERVAPLRNAGGGAINEMVINQLESDEIFREYKDEVMSLLRPAMQGGQVLRLEVAREALNLVAGRHRNDIRAREKEKDARKRKADGDAPMPGDTTGRKVNAPDVARETIKDLFGDRAEAAWEVKRGRRGGNEDTEAQRMGYADKQDWFRKTKEMDEVAVKTNRSFGLDV